MGSHNSATPKKGFIHGNAKPYFSPLSGRETMLSFDSGNSYKFPDAIMYYMIDTGTLIDHEGKFAKEFVQDVISSHVIKQNVITHRGEIGPKARGELQKGDIGYCEQEDVDNPVKWDNNIASFEVFTRKLLEIVPHLKEIQLVNTSIDSILSKIEPQFTNSVNISTASSILPIIATDALPKKVTPIYRGSYTASAPQKSLDGKYIVIELHTASYGNMSDAQTVETMLRDQQKNDIKEIEIIKREVRGPTIIEVKLPVTTPNQCTNDAVIAIAKNQLTHFIMNALPGIKQDKSII